MSAFQLHPSRWIAILAGLVLFFVVISGKVRYTFGDARYALLESQAILEDGTYRLDDYVNELPLGHAPLGPGWVIFHSEKNGHFYYDYPVGTSVFALPFVAVARAWGMNPASYWDDDQLQIFIAATLLVVVFLLLIRLSLLYLDDWAALVFSLLFVAGTSLMSGMGTALWSFDFETVFLLLGVLELAEVARGKRPKVRGIWFGFLLFAAYLCRPTAMVFILLGFIYLGWKQRKALLPAMVTSAALLGLFVLWSLLEMQVWLPRYYQPGNWKPYGEFFHNLWPIWLGPARGLFSFTPILLLGLLGWAFAKQRKDPLYILMWVWFALHTWMVLKSKTPWGGWCYGPRFYTEILPGLALTLLMTFESLEHVRLRWKQIVGTAFLVFSCFGVYVHTWQGLYTPQTADWNDHPNIDEAWAMVRWDWRYPQFLASPHQLDVRKRENDMAAEVSTLLDQIPANGTLLFGLPDPGTRAVFAHWNRKDVLRKGKPVFNSVMAISKAGYKEFWFKPDLRDFLRTDWRVVIDPPIVDSIMGPDSTMIAAPLPVLCHALLKIDAP
jgi:hypothetical protein